jgi:hypothetical protein
MADDGPWLNVQQAAVLEVTRDIELVAGLSAETTPLLVIKTNRLLARHIEFPLGRRQMGVRRRSRAETPRIGALQVG